MLQLRYIPHISQADKQMANLMHNHVNYAMLDNEANITTTSVSVHARSLQESKTSTLRKAM